MLVVEPYKRYRLANTIEKRFTSNEEEAYTELQKVGQSINDRLTAIEQNIGTEQSHARSHSFQLGPTHSQTIVLPEWVSRLQHYVSKVLSSVVAFTSLDIDTISTACGLVGGALLTWMITGVFT